MPIGCGARRVSEYDWIADSSAPNDEHPTIAHFGVAAGLIEIGDAFLTELAGSAIAARSCRIALVLPAMPNTELAVTGRGAPRNWMTANQVTSPGRVQPQRQ